MGSLLERIKTKSNTNNSKQKRENFWNYYFEFEGQKTKVCKFFLINLYQISRTRIETVQQKMVKGVVIADNRGLTRDINKIDNNVWDS